MLKMHMDDKTYNADLYCYMTLLFFITFRNLQSCRQIKEKVMCGSLCRRQKMEKSAHATFVPRVWHFMEEQLILICVNTSLRHILVNIVKRVPNKRSLWRRCSQKLQASFKNHVTLPKVKKSLICWLIWYAVICVPYWI